MKMNGSIFYSEEEREKYASMYGQVSLRRRENGNLIHIVELHKIIVAKLQKNIKDYVRIDLYTNDSIALYMRDRKEWRLESELIARAYNHYTLYTLTDRASKYLPVDFRKRLIWDKDVKLPVLTQTYRKQNENY